MTTSPASISASVPFTAAGVLLLAELLDEGAPEGSVSTASKHARNPASEPALAPLRLATPGSCAQDAFLPATPAHAVGTKAVART